MELDTLLKAAGERSLTSEERSVVIQLVDSVEVPRRRRRPRRSVLVALVTVGGLLVGGGVTAATAAVLGHPTWYDAASDWSQTVRTVTRDFAVDGQQHSCTTPITLKSLHDGKQIPEFREALRFITATHPGSVAPDQEVVQAMTSSNWDPPPTAVQINEMAWEQAFSNTVWNDLKAHGLNSELVSMEFDPKCDAGSR